MQLSGGYNAAPNPNRKLYNAGSEWQDDIEGLADYYSTFFREYDPMIGRFNGVDPMCEATENITNYAYSNNNPIMMNDPLGNTASDDRRRRRNGQASGEASDNIFKSLGWYGPRMRDILDSYSSDPFSSGWEGGGGGSFDSYSMYSALKSDLMDYGNSGDPDFLAISNKYGANPYLWHDDLEGKNSLVIVITVLLKAGGNGPLDAVELYTILIGEGFNQWLSFKDDPQAIIKGFNNMGLDHFSDDADNLKKKGFLPSKFTQGNQYTTSPGVNEKHQVVNSADFKDLESALIAFSATAQYRAHKALDQGAKLGYGEATKSQRMFWAYVFFQTPSTDLLRTNKSWDYNNFKLDKSTQNPMGIPSKAFRRMITSEFIQLKVNRITRFWP